MGSWNDILKEVNETQSQYDYIRRKYLKELSEYTGRNTIAYYSSWLNKQANNLDINDADMTGFMTCIHGLDCSKGLDLILHTPGGSPAAAEAIVSYLRAKFGNDIRVIVPQLAMSAGTMIACSAKEIIMGKQSSLGPIDPQFNGIPAYNIMMEFEEAKKDLLDNPKNAQYWAIKLQQYPAAFMKTAIDAIEHDDSKIHGRHFNAEFCRSIGLKISMMEDDGQLQDKILSVHHAYMITLDGTPTIKIIENHQKKSVISNIQIVAR